MSEIAEVVQTKEAVAQIIETWRPSKSADCQAVIWNPRTGRYTPMRMVRREVLVNGQTVADEALANA